MILADSVISNYQYLNCLLRLGRLLSHDIFLRITIIPPPSSPSPSSPHPPPPPPPPPSASSPSPSSALSSSTTKPSATVSVSAVKVEEFESFDKCYVPDDEWSEEMYSAKDIVSQLWVIFYHLIDQRNETRIFGASYTTQKTLYEKVHALQSDFSHGTPISIYVSSFYVLDDLSCQTVAGDDDAATLGSTNKMGCLVGVFDALRSLSNGQYGVLFKAHRQQLDKLPAEPPEDNTSVVVDVNDGEGHTYRVWEPCLGYYRVQLKASTNTNDQTTRDALAKLLQAIMLKRQARSKNDRLNILNSTVYKDTFMKDISVTDLLTLKHQKSSNEQTQRNTSGVQLEVGTSTEDLSACVKYYQRLAAMAWYATWNQVDPILTDLDNVAASDALHFLYDYMGPGITSRIAAVGYSPVPQRGFKQMSYSPFELMTNNDSPVIQVSLPISAAALRDVGRLSVDDNVIKPPLMTSFASLIAIENPTSSYLSTTKFSSELVIKADIPDQKKIS